MQYNHGKAWREFRKQWKEKERQYRQSGMTDYQINKIYAYDLMMFRSDRRFYEHCVDIQSEEYNEKLAVTDEYFRHDVETWIEALDESIKQELKKRPKDQLRAFYLYRVDGYSQIEISSILLKSQRTISRWISEIADFLKKHRKDG